MPGHRTRETIQIYVYEIVLAEQELAEQGLSSDVCWVRVGCASQSQS